MANGVKSQFSDKTVSVNLPVDFFKVASGLSRDALLVLLGYFQFMSEQERDSQLCEAFDLENYLPVDWTETQIRFASALDELDRVGALFVFSSPETPERKYLLPGTDAGASLLHSLQEQPSLLTNLSLATALPAPAKPNVFRLYEENIGPLTAYSAELLRDAAETYTEEWLEDAIKEAVHYNARNWKYIQAILRNWQEKGRKRSNEEDKRDLESFRKLYLDQKRELGT